MSTWLAWLAAKMTGASRSARRSSPRSCGRGDDPGQRAGHVVEHHGPGQAHRVRPRPGGVVVDAELGLGGGPGTDPGQVGAASGNAPGRPGRASADGRRRRRAAPPPVVARRGVGRAPPGAVAQRPTRRSWPAVHGRHCTSAIRIGRGVQVGEGGGGADHVAGPSPGRRPGWRRPGSRAGARRWVAAHDDDRAQVLRGRGRTSTTCRRDGRRGRRGPSGRGGCTTGRWRRPPRTGRPPRRVGGLAQHLLEEVDVARVVDRVELPRGGVGHDQHPALADQRACPGRG